MRVSLNITDPAAPEGRIPAGLDRVAAVAEDAGLDTVWVDDHLLQNAPGSVPDDDKLEAYTTLGYLAARTERVRLGTMVTAATYRAPTVLIKAVTTLDVLSGGRARLGIGSGYNEQEASDMGVPLPPKRERFDRLEDTVRLARQMWAGDSSPFHGRHFTVARPVGAPRPVGRDRLPILIGGVGERRTLRLVAEHADACNLFDIPDGGETLRRKLDVLAGHCADVGRPYGEIEKTVMTRVPAGDVDGFAEHCADLAQIGLEHVVLMSTGPWTEASLADVAAAVPAVAGIEAAA